MLELTLLTLGLLGQVGKVDTPTMQFTNNTRERISLMVYCRDTGRWENNRQALVVRANATASIKLHEGRFQVVARNDSGHEDRNERKLVARELDWMDISGIYGDPRPGVSRFKIEEHAADDEVTPPASPAPAAPPAPPAPPAPAP